MSNFTFSHSVFKKLVSQGRQKVSLCGNGLTTDVVDDTMIFSVLTIYLGSRKLRALCMRLLQAFAFEIVLYSLAIGAEYVGKIYWMTRLFTQSKFLKNQRTFVGSEDHKMAVDCTELGV